MPPAIAMMWVAISADGRYPFVCTDNGVINNTKYYWQNILKGVQNISTSKQDNGHTYRPRYYCKPFVLPKNDCKRRLPKSIVFGVFWKIKLALNKIKVSIILRKSSPLMDQKYCRAAFGQNVMVFLIVWKSNQISIVTNFITFSLSYRVLM